MNDAVCEFLKTLPGAIRVNGAMVAEIKDEYPTLTLSGDKVTAGTYAYVTVEVLIPMPSK